MKNKLILGLIAIVVVVGGAILLTNSSKSGAGNLAAVGSALEVSKVRIANLPIVHGLPLYVAIDKGYFTEAGIEVEMVPFEAPNQIIDAILTGQVDFTSPAGALGITGIADFKNPGKMKVYAVSGGSAGNSGANVIVPGNSTLTSLADLKGKKLGILAGTIQWRTIAREILKQNGLDVDTDLTIVELAPSVQIQALTSGQVDALLALQPIPTTAVNSFGAKVLLADPTVKYIADPSWLGAGVVNTAFAAKNPRTTAAVIEILNRVSEEINKDPDQYRQYLKGYTSLTDDLIAKVPIVDFKVCGSLTEKDKDSMQKFFDIFTKHGVVDGHISVDALLYCK